MSDEQIKSLVEEHDWYGVVIAAAGKMMAGRKCPPKFATLNFDEGEGMPATRLVISSEAALQRDLVSL